MTNTQKIVPDHTAVRVALWRALHVLLDNKPVVFNDEIGAKLVGEHDWMKRQDMDSSFSKSMRASIVGRARFVEDLLEEQISKGTHQYVILGAGLDTFAQRRSDLSSQVEIFEIDQPDTQAWKKRRLEDLGYGMARNLKFVPVDFESGESWWAKLQDCGFDRTKPAVFVSTGVSLYLSKKTNLETFQQIAKMASGSVFAMTFLLSLDLLPSDEKRMMEFVMKKASESGTPFLSLFTPQEITALAMQAGFKVADYVSAQDIYDRYFAARTDGLNAGTAEGFVIAKI